MFSPSTVTYTAVYINSEPWRLQYIVDSDPKKDEKDPKEDPAYYPADRVNNDDDESSNDDDNDDDVDVSTDDLVPSS
nr:hypothetical protein [Tanacetum cinerariifolium]